MRGHERPSRCPRGRLRHDGILWCQVPLAKIADGPKVWALLAHNSDEGQIPFTGQRDFSARKHPDTVRIEQQTDQHRRIERWGTPGFLLVGGVEAAQLQLGDRIEQEEDQVALGELGLRAMGFLPVALWLPGTVRFSTVLAHAWSPRVAVAE